MRTKIPTARERQPNRQSHTNEANQLEKGLSDAVRRSNRAVDDKINRLMREKYSDATDQNA
jgi:hypothetical protein